MSTRHFMSHQGSNFSNPFKRMEQEGYFYSYAGENIATGIPSIELVLKAWESSPAHLANILNPHFIHIGIACVNNFWTADFGAPFVKWFSPSLQSATYSEHFTSSIRTIK